MIDRELLRQYTEKYRYNIEDVKAEINNIADISLKFGIERHVTLNLIEEGMRSINYEM